MFSDPQVMYGGNNYIKTHIAIATAFKGMDSFENNYRSETFEKFLEYREIIAERLQQRYMGTTYPDRGFLRGTALAGNTYSLENGRINRSSSDVLIPAFLAAYSGKDPKRIDLNPFPGIKAILPNWHITYSLVQLPFLKKLFKEFRLEHRYDCAYKVNSFSSYSDWVTIGEGLGFTQDVLNSGDIPGAIPSSPYNIPSVMLEENFMPLIGVSSTFFNDMTLSIKYEKKRNLTLNSAAGQLVENSSQGFSVTGAFKIANFNQVLKLKSKQKNFNNDLELSLNVKMQSSSNIIRNFDTEITRATTGTRTWNIDFQANYNVSKRIKMGAYYNYTSNTPLVSQNSYPTTSSNYGLQITMELVK